MFTLVQMVDQKVPASSLLSLQTTLATPSNSLTDTIGKDVHLRSVRTALPTTSPDVVASAVPVEASVASQDAVVQVSADVAALAVALEVAVASVVALAAHQVADLTTKLPHRHPLHQTHSPTMLLPELREARQSMFATYVA